MEVPVTKRVLVVGAGVSGMTAAADLAESGFEVYLIEHKPYVGGHLPLINKLYSGRDSLEILNPLIEGLYNTKINLFLNSEVREVEGYIGNFNVQIVQRPRYVNETCILCGKCVDVCPVTIPNHINSGIGERKAVFFPFENCHPSLYVVDDKNCIKCMKCLEVCPSNAIDLIEKPLEISLEIGAIIVTTGFETYRPKKGEFGYEIYDDVITQLTLERLLSVSGPTEGELVKPSDGGRVDGVAFILCVGSRQDSQEGGNAYCSRFCCTTALKNAFILKEMRPNTEVYVLYRDIRTFGRGHEDLYRRCRERGVLFIRYNQEDPPRVKKIENRLVVSVRDLLFGVIMELGVDLLVLGEGMVPPRDIDETQMLFGLTRSSDGFFQEAHPKLNPLDTFTEGVFIGGAAQGPKDVEDAISQASGAASKAAILLHRGKVVINLVTATVDEDLCVGCGKCVDVCPYNALEMDEVDEIVEVTEVKCKGCGSCSATCPVGAIQVRHYLDSQILAMVETSMGV
jgi:heterodisulfide reductase subunit A